MTCREFTEFLDRFLADELSSAERTQFERHLSVCKDCTNYLDTYKQTLEVTDEALAASDGEVPADVPDALVDAVMAAIDKS